MHTVRSSGRPGGLHQAPPRPDPLGPGTPQDQTPRDQTPPGPGTPPWTESQTHYRNITFPQLRLRAVTTVYNTIIPGRGLDVFAMINIFPGTVCCSFIY